MLGIQEEVNVGPSGRWGSRTPGAGVSGRGGGGRWSSWWGWSPGSNSLRRQDWSKRRNVLTDASKTVYGIYRTLITAAGWKWMCAWCTGSTLTLVKVELLVWRAIPESFDVHQVAVNVWIVQCAESHIYKSRRVSPAWVALRHFLFWFLTCCLLLLDGHGHRRTVLHACRHNHLWGRHSNHRRGGRSGCRWRGYGGLLDGFFGWLRWNWDSVVLIQLPLYCALNLGSAKEDRIGRCLQLNKGFSHQLKLNTPQTSIHFNFFYKSSFI